MRLVDDGDAVGSGSELDDRASLGRLVGERRHERRLGESVDVDIVDGDELGRLA